MRVLVVTQYYWPENFLINNLVLKLSARGVGVTVLSGKPNYPDGKIFPGYRAIGVQKEQHESVVIRRVPIVPRGRRSKIKLALNYISFMGSCLLLGRYLVRDREYDLVFVYAPSPLLQALPAVWLARQRRVPLAVWVQDLWPESLSATGYVKNRFLLALVARVVRFIYRYSDRILVQSRAFVQSIAKMTEEPEKIHYYPNFYQVLEGEQVSESALELVEALKMHFSVVFTGNLGTAQSLGTIVEAARQLLPYPNIRIVLVGSGSLDDWLSQQRDIHKLNNLILAGRFDASDMSAICAAAQALIVTLKDDPAFRSTVPSKVQAYLAAGKPILAALDGEGARIVCEACAGLSSPAEDANGLVRNILRLNEMPIFERKKMGQNGRLYFNKHFSPDILVDELIEHFKEIIGEKEKKQ